MALTIDWIIAVRRVAALAAVAALVGLGCGPRFNWEGKWVGHRKLVAQTGQSPEAVRVMSLVELTIHGNGTFDLFEGGIPRAGRVLFGSSTCSLHAVTVLGRNVDDMSPADRKAVADVEITARKDGTIELVDPSGFDDSAVLLQRQVQPPKDSTRTN